MGPLEIALSIVGVAIGFGAWLWPRAPKSDAPTQATPIVTAAPAPATALSPTLVVTVAMGMVGIGPDIGAPRIILGAVNTGSRKQRIEMINLQEERTKNQLINPFPQSVPSLPCTLEETQSVTSWMEAKQVAQTLRQDGQTGRVRLRACVRNSYNERYYSDWMEFEVDRFADYSSSE